MRVQYGWCASFDDFDLAPNVVTSVGRTQTSSAPLRSTVHVGMQGGGAIAASRHAGGSASKGADGDDEGITVKDVLVNVRRIVVFVLICYVFYSPFGTRWINNPATASVDGWDENRTSAAWDTDQWDWDFIDCLYFAMCTMTTVGYGDMPTLRQEMRVFTIVFGLVGVVVVAGSITVIADWFAQQGRKRFLAQQKALLAEAASVAEGVRSIVSARGEDPMAPAAADPEPAPTGDVPHHASSSASASRGGGDMGSQAQAVGGSTTLGRLCDALWSRLPGPKKRKYICSVLKALRLTGIFFLLSIIMGEVENAFVPACGFGSGWSCGGAYSCELWKLGAWEADADGTDRGFCWTWIDQLVRVPRASLPPRPSASRAQDTSLPPSLPSFFSFFTFPRPLLSSLSCLLPLDAPAPPQYFASMTYVTIGYGDVTPHSKVGKLLGALMVTLGLITFTLFFSELYDIAQAEKLGADKTLLMRLEELNEVIDSRHTPPTHSRRIDTHRKHSSPHKLSPEPT